MKELGTIEKIIKATDAQWWDFVKDLYGLIVTAILWSIAFSITAAVIFLIIAGIYQLVIALPINWGMVNWNVVISVVISILVVLGYLSEYLEKKRKLNNNK